MLIIIMKVKYTILYFFVNQNIQTCEKKMCVVTQIPNCTLLTFVQVFHLQMQYYSYKLVDSFIRLENDTLSNENVVCGIHVARTGIQFV